MTIHTIAPVGGLAHVAGDTSKPLLELTIPQLLARTVKQNGPREAAVFVEQNRRFTWDEFAATVDDLAAGLLALGLKTGDRVAMWSPNRWEWLITQFATARVGMILVNINPAYRLSELEYALNKVGCRALVTAAAFKTSDYLGMIRTLAIVIRVGDEKTPGMLNFADVLAMGQGTDRADLDRISAGLDPNDAVNIQFTSGTTGAPKGATLTHRNIVNNADQVTTGMRFSRDDRLCIPVPFYHCFGMSMGTLGCVTKGATMVVPSEGFDPLATLKAVSQEKCTALYGVPTMFVAMLDHPQFVQFDFSALRTGIMAGAPCPVEVMKKVGSLMNMREVTIAYGMTETSPVSFQSAVDDPLEKRVSTVGRIRPHLEVKVIDEKGATVPVGQSGELCTKGYSVMQGYWDDPERTAEAIDADGWMHTGDLATIDDEGYANIVGRVKDMVIRGGENVYPREIEEFLYRHPKIAQVQVFGVPDKKYGEEIAAWVVVAPGQSLTEDEVKDFCKGQIAHYKVPRYVQFRAELPMTVTGKPQKFIMRDTMIEELRLTVEKTA